MFVAILAEILAIPSSRPRYDILDELLIIKHSLIKRHLSCFGSASSTAV